MIDCSVPLTLIDLFDSLNLSLLETIAPGFCFFFSSETVYKRGVNRKLYSLSLQLDLEPLIDPHVSPILPVLDFPHST